MTDHQFMFRPFAEIANEVRAGARLSRDEALQLFRHAPLLDLGALAHERKRARHGDTCTYIVNRQINPTNLCIHSCRFCDFAARPRDAHAYVLTEDQIIADLHDPEVCEVHITGGLWKTWDLDRATALIRRIRRERPHLWIKGFTAVEIDFFSRRARCGWEAVLRNLIDAGLDAMPGGGAEVLNSRIHHELFAEKMGPADWLAIHELAHRLGLPSNATLLFGHIETDEEIIDHLISLRELEDRAPGFQAFIPLAFQPGETGIVDRLVAAPRCLRVVAISRLVFDNVPHVKSYWPTLQVETGAAALTFGADDLDGTLGRERIMHLAGSETPSGLTARFMEQLIRDAGQQPSRRSGRFDALGPAVAQESAPVLEVTL